MYKLAPMKQDKILVAPSILAGDFGHIADEVKRIEQAGADAVHVDIMDGHFVPNLTIGPKVLAAINSSTELFLDVHIMIYNPYDYVERLVEAGADRITFHFEATEDVEDTLAFIRKCGVEAGLAFCPETSVEFVPKFLDQCDLILMMTVPPGFGGQKFHSEVLEKIRFVRQTCDKLKLSVPIEVDGGIDDQTAPLCIEAGASILVAGTYLFKNVEMRTGIETLRGGGEK